MITSLLRVIRTKIIKANMTRQILNRLTPKNLSLCLTQRHASTVKLFWPTDRHHLTAGWNLPVWSCWWQVMKPSVGLNPVNAAMCGTNSKHKSSWIKPFQFRTFGQIWVQVKEVGCLAPLTPTHTPPPTPTLPSSCIPFWGGSKASEWKKKGEKKRRR